MDADSFNAANGIGIRRIKEQDGNGDWVGIAIVALEHAPAGSSIAALDG